jgi:hypothetical protein
VFWNRLLEAYLYLGEEQVTAGRRKYKVKGFVVSYTYLLQFLNSIHALSYSSIMGTVCFKRLPVPTYGRI